MSDQNPKNRAEESSYPGFEDRITYNPAAEDSSDSIKKNISDIRSAGFDKVATILPQSMPVYQDDDEDVPTGVKDWNEPKTILTTVAEINNSERDDGYEIVSEDEISIGDLPEDVQDELAIDEALHNLGNPEGQFNEANALYSDEDKYNDEDIGPAAGVFDVYSLQVASPTISPPENQEILDQALKLQVDSHYQYLDKGKTLDLSPYASVIWEFMDSRYAKAYFKELRTYERSKYQAEKRKELYPRDSKTKEPQVPPKVETYLKQFQEELKRKQKK